ncbi:RidA family protein [Labedaea rhizosphaerae]|nr:Rid family hydrolase [Labedaea rhizosphaerae]
MTAVIENPVGAPGPVGPYSQVARIDVGAATLLVLSGQIGVDDDGNVLDGVAAQSERIFDIVAALLSAYGATLADVVNIRTYMLDLGQLADYGAVRRARMAGRQPTSTTVQVAALFKPGALLEVEVTAVLAKEDPAPSSR